MLLCSQVDYRASPKTIHRHIKQEDRSHDKTFVNELLVVVGKKRINIKILVSNHFKLESYDKVSIYIISEPLDVG